MATYKELYAKMFMASEQAINILIKAQRECEEMYLSLPEEELPLLKGLHVGENPIDEA